MSDTTSHSIAPVPIRVLLADDEALVRAGFRVLVDSAPDLTVVGEAGTGGEAVRLTRRLRPDVVLMDIRMPVMDGLEAMRHIAADAADGPHVLIVTTFDQDEHVFRALRNGAGGFILKDSSPELLLHAIRVVASGDALLTPSITRRLISEFARRPAVPTSGSEALAALTEREREVLGHIAAGSSNAEIGAALYVGVATVKTHVGRLLTKLGARDRAQLVVFAYESGVVIPGGSAQDSSIVSPHRMRRSGDLPEAQAAPSGRADRTRRDGPLSGPGRRPRP